jgi:hypothetical protein
MRRLSADSQAGTIPSKPPSLKHLATEKQSANGFAKLKPDEFTSNRNCLRTNSSAHRSVFRTERKRRRLSRCPSPLCFSIEVGLLIGRRFFLNLQSKQSCEDTRRLFTVDLSPPVDSELAREHCPPERSAHLAGGVVAVRLRLLRTSLDPARTGETFRRAARQQVTSLPTAMGRDCLANAVDFRQPRASMLREQRSPTPPS